MPENRRKAREHKQHDYLKDYHCYLATNSDTIELEKNKLYPISSVVSYEKMLDSHRTFSIVILTQQEPKSYKIAAQQEEWQDAMSSELKALDDNETWDIVTLPKDNVPISCKCVFKIKRKSDESIERYKARLVAKGFTEQYGIDYIETFSPVSK